MSGVLKKTRSRPKNLRYWSDPFMVFIVLGVAIGFGGFLYWSLTAQLAQGVTASGLLAVQNQRREIQHLEGGIISSIAIQDGQVVAQGDTLIELRDASADARLRQVDAERAAKSARLDRLEASLEEADDLTFPRLSKITGDSFDPAGLMRAEAQVFRDQIAALKGQRGLVRAKLARLTAQKASIATRVRGKERELATLQEELVVQQQALAQQMGNISRLNASKLSVSVAASEIESLRDEDLVVDSTIQEAQQELLQVDLLFRSDVSSEMTLLRAEILALDAEREALLDRQERQRIVAPISGSVIDLAYPAIGGVVPAGETIFDLVPLDKTWRVDVRFAPQDRDNLVERRLVNLRFGTLDPINPPEVTGVLDVIAADSTENLQTGEVYYEAQVSIGPAALDAITSYELSPGIPVEVFMDSGVTRTPFSYFTEPIELMLRRGFRG